MNSASGRARARWTRIIGQQRRSGLSVARFCERRGIATSSLFAWQRRLRDPVWATDASEPVPSGFVEVGLRGSGGGAGVVGFGVGEGGVTIELAHGRRVMVGRGFDPRLLLDVVNALESGGQRPGEPEARAHEHALGVERVGGVAP